MPQLRILQTKLTEKTDFTANKMKRTSASLKVIPLDQLNIL